jgi:hypothetical protein
LLIGVRSEWKIEGGQGKQNPEKKGQTHCDWNDDFLPARGRSFWSNWAVRRQRFFSSPRQPTLPAAVCLHYKRARKQTRGKVPFSPDDQPGALE